MPPSCRTWTNWMNGKTYKKLLNYKIQQGQMSCPIQGDKKAPETPPSGDRVSWEQLCEKTSKSADLHLSLQEPQKQRQPTASLGCMKSGMGLRSTEGIVTFYIGLVRLYLNTTLSFGSSNTWKTRTNWTELIGGPKGSGVWSICPMRRGWELGRVSLEKRQLQGH